METVFDYTIPVLHPWVVHFPVALLTAAALAAVVWAARGRVFWRRATLLLLALGTAGAAAAYLTGEAMKEQSEGVPIVDALVGLHEQAALYTLIASGVAAAALAAGVFWLERRTTIRRDPPDPLVLRLVLGALVLLAATLAAWTGHVGGVMAWGIPA